MTAEAGQTLVAKRKLVPAELRLVELGPGDPPASAVFPAFGTGLATVAAAFFFHQPLVVLASPVVALVTFAVAGPGKEARRLRPTPMTVTPWGIEARGAAYPWVEVRAIRHAHTFSQRGSEEDKTVGFSELTVIVGDQHLSGKRRFVSMLDVLDAVLAPYSLESGRAISLSLGAGGGSVRPTEKEAFATILHLARAFLSSEGGRELLEVEQGGYRESETRVRPETIAVLDRALVEAPETLDRAPFAAVIAAELGVTSLVDRLCELVMSPNVLVAGVARAAAQRLGAHPSRAGQVSELRPFLPDDEIAALEGWARGE